MGVRELMNRYGAVVVVVVLLVLGVATWNMISRMRGPSQQLPPSMAETWYYDLTTNELFVGSAELTPPIPAPSGGTQADGAPAGVLAHVYSCGDCATSSQVGYLEQASPEARAAMEQLRGLSADPRFGDAPPAARRSIMENPEQAVLVRAPDADAQWFPIDSPEGEAVVRAAMSMCGEGARPRPCRPSD